ncbi:MAG: outer membrane protein assembly factor BamB family protein, partial [Planctomycetota bacterium]
MRIARPVFAVVLLLAVSSSSTANEEVFRGRPYSVPDSQEVLFRKEKARKAVAVGSFDKAALKLQQILDYYPNDVLLVGRVREERFLGARAWVHEFLRGLPPEGREAYRTLTGPLARRLLERAAAQRDETLLEELLRRFYLSGVGPAALRAYATLLLTEGRYADAAHHLSRLLRDFPEAVGNEDVARLAFAQVRGGDTEGFERLMLNRPSYFTSDEPVAVAGASVPFREFLARLLAEHRSRAAEPAHDPSSWPVYGGSPDRARPAPTLPKLGPVQWSVVTGYSDKDADYPRNVYSGSYGGSSRHLAIHHPIHPVVDRGVVYFHNGFVLNAVNLYTGKVLWSSQGPLGFSEGKTNAGTVLSPAVKDGVVFVNLEVQAPRPPSTSRQYAGHTVIYYIPQRRLFAMEAKTGKVLWSHEDRELVKSPDREILAGINVNSPPLVIGDTVYVTASRQLGRYFCYVLAVDARTGRVRWHTRICTGQQELNLFGRPVKELAPGALSERDGTLYCSTNLGVAAALDRRTGAIEWIKGYPQIPIPFSMRWHTTAERSPTWANAPPVVTEDAVYLTPTDSWDLIALKREDGSLLFRYPGGYEGFRQDEPRYLLGVGPRHVFLAGQRLLAVHRRTGKLVWKGDRGNFNRSDDEREVAIGRGVVTPGAVYVMTRYGLYAFDPDTGERLSFEPLVSGEDEKYLEGGGNLVVAGHILLQSMKERIRAFYLWDRIYDELKRRAQEEPGNHRLALEVGEVYSQGKRFGEAVEAFERARKLAAKLPEPERLEVALAARKGLFRIHMLQGEKAQARGKRPLAALHFRKALGTAVDDTGKIRAILALVGHYRQEAKLAELRGLLERLEAELGQVVYDFPSIGETPAGLYALLGLTELALDEGRPRDAIGHLSRIIARYPRRDTVADEESHVYARHRIDRIVATHGRGVFEPFERKARELLVSAKRASSANGLEEVTRLYPNSRAAGVAALALGRLLLLEGDYRRASLVLRRILSESPDSPSAPTLLHLLAEALIQRGYLVSAKSTLSRLARLHGKAEIEVDGRTVVAEEYVRRQLEDERFQKLGADQAKVKLPLLRLWMEDEGERSYVRVLDSEGTPPVGAASNLLLGTNGVLKAVDARSKRTVWQREMNGLITRPMFVEGTLVLVNTTSFTGVEPDTGEKSWEIPNESSVRALKPNAGTAFVLTADFRNPKDLVLQAIAPRDGAVLWRKEIKDHQLYDHLLVTDEAVTIASRDPSGVTVFDASTGRVRFRVPMAPRSLYREPLLVDDDKLFVVHGNRKVELYDSSSGQQVWSRLLPDERYYRSAVPAPGGVFVTDTDENLMVLEASDGSVRWRVPPAPKTPLVYQGEAADSERVYVVRRRDKDGVYLAEARDVRTGEILWRTDLLESRSATPTPVLADDYVLYHVNSYDFGQNAWVSSSIFLDKGDGSVRQKIAPDEFQG